MSSSWDLDPGCVSRCRPKLECYQPLSGLWAAERTSNTANQLLSDATARRVLELKGEFAQVTEIRPALDDENISVVTFSAQDFGVDIVSFPGCHTFRDVVQVIVSTEDQIHTVR